jgi:acetyl-CoA synthetase
MSAESVSKQARLFHPSVAVPADYGHVPERLNITGEVLDKSLALGRGALIAFVGPAGELRYDELNRRVCNFAAACAAQGIARGDRVLVRLFNCFEFPVALLGLMKLGAVPVAGPQ